MPKKYGKSLNYNFKDQKEPNKRMGQGDFANLPEKPIFKDYETRPQYRGGVVNSYVCSLADETGIYENQKGETD